MRLPWPLSRRREGENRRGLDRLEGWALVPVSAALTFLLVLLSGLVLGWGCW